ncbi:orotate phosphoribosyltransferase [Glomus cerebriforme]|uniref:orotate phosphoribosyltransferase n=1 Tax=Glomus cerebriforme TaxID=658196 RepID=A0A397T9Y7_9GLOM|nr:orotate phosphoribosyltransferase [Glomus cerebriforme]
MSLKPYQHDFIKWAIEQDALTFGTYTLKSGRFSPYFYDAAKFNKGSAFLSVGQFYVDVLQNLELNYDVVFGSAYKGIPIALSTVTALKEKYNLDVGYSFNRKEIKIHGEKGNIVGAPLKGNVLIVDDVISVGTAIRECLKIVKDNGANPVGIVIALDRQEKGTGEVTVVQQIAQEYGVPVISIITLDNIVQYITEVGGYEEHLTMIEKYQDTYGVKKLI